MFLNFRRQTIQHLLQTKLVASLDAELLLAHILHCSRETIISHPTDKVGFFKMRQFKKLLKKRQQGVPLAYLTGHKEFFGLDFLVNKHVLIPRPETEILVEEVLKILQANNILLDVGTGSGCIPIAINKHKKIRTYATDISRHALRVAKKNAKKHGININFLHGNLLSPISKFKIQNSKLLITANLPYLTKEQYQTEPSIQYEPKSALVAKNNGLALYEKLLKQIQKLTAYNLQLTTFLEIDPSQTQTITSLIKKYLPTAAIKIKKDLAGLDRVVEIHIIPE